ncbi:flagellar hook capping FlgD N-terminal domain-containing protein [Paracoccus siganidrum]|nr:flagellar hook capping FlgD N-terminal domain-containing protein [Paracoccus siganidrum]
MISAVGNSPADRSMGSGAISKAQEISSDFNAFLRMLTTQMQNQDPLNPMESTEFAVQLATFSSVEQQAQTNKLLNEMIAQLGGSGLGQVADWIGKEARTSGPVWFGNAALTLDVAPDSRADSVTLVTLDASGLEVKREEIGPGSGQVDWYGRDAHGEKLADGRYSFRTESSFNGQVISEQAVGVYSRITEAETGANGVTLILQGGVPVAANAVEALREAP